MDFQYFSMWPIVKTEERLSCQLSSPPSRCLGDFNCAPITIFKLLTHYFLYFCHDLFLQIKDHAINKRIFILLTRAWAGD